VDNHLKQAYLLISRLERLSVDSYWAHRASGVRGSLLRAAEQVETGKGIPGKLDELIKLGFDILENAVDEILR
jgi:hypothetical protein